MKNVLREPESQARIRFPDCDPFHHLNNSRYIDYLFNAREDHLLTCYDFDIHHLAASRGIGWVCAHTQIAYLQPAVLNELVTIATRLLYAGEKSLLLEASMWDLGKNQLKSLMWSRLVHYNLRERRSQAHSPELADLFGQIVYPLPENRNFEERVSHLKTNLPSIV